MAGDIIPEWRATSPGISIPPPPLGLGDITVLPIGPIQRRKVARDAGLDLLDALADLGHREVLVAIVDGLELAPVDRNDSLVNRLSRRHGATNCVQAARIAGPLSRRKSAIVLKSGISRPVSHISSMLRWVSRSSRRLDWMQLR